MSEVVDEQPAPEPRPNRRVGQVVAVIAALTVLTGVFAWGATKYSSVNGQLNDIEAIRRVAGEFGATTLTYDYKDLPSFDRRMRAHATGTFKRQLGEGLPGLKTLITQLKSHSEATVKQVLVSDIDEHSASALVVVEAKAQNGDAPARTLDDAYIELQLVKAGKRWLIDGVSTLDLGQGSSGPAVPGVTTTTTRSSS
ncbi:MAG TPA: hypothetical protein VFB78_01300 [Acidimicrobiales bacterium]|nr:hypothetical protein [Acidimicrobiales bacterium]